MHSNINILYFNITHQQPQTKLTDARIQNNTSLQEEYILLHVRVMSTWICVSLSLPLKYISLISQANTSKTLQDRKT